MPGRALELEVSVTEENPANKPDKHDERLQDVQIVWIIHGDPKSTDHGAESMERPNQARELRHGMGTSCWRDID
jgi:hypothetical protein